MSKMFLFLIILFILISFQVIAQQYAGTMDSVKISPAFQIADSNFIKQTPKHYNFSKDSVSKGQTKKEKSDLNPGKINNLKQSVIPDSISLFKRVPKKKKIVKLNHPVITSTYYAGNNPSNFYNYSGLDNYWNTEGELKTILGEYLPINFIFSYTNKNAGYGLGNHLKIEFDKNEIEKIREKEERIDVTSLKNKIHSTDSVKSDFLRREVFLNEKLSSLKNQKNNNPVSNVDTTQAGLYKAYPSFNKTYLDNRETSVDSLHSNLNDTLNLNSTGWNGNKTGSFNHGPTDTVINAQKNIYQINDTITSIQKELSEIREKLKKINSESDSLHNLSDKLTSSYPNTQDINKNKGLLNNLFFIRNFEIGYCHPDYSTFLINGITLKGLNFEYQSPWIYFASSAGNVWYPGNDQLTNFSTSGIDSVHIYYSPQTRPEEKTNLISVKSGLGQTSGNHFYVGYLNGKLKKNDENYKQVVNNSVYELDGQYVIKKTSVNLVFGHSIVKNNYVDNLIPLGPIAANSLSSGNALGARVRSEWDKIKSTFNFSSTYTKPTFRSLGMNNNPGRLKLDLRTSHYPLRKLKFGLIFRREYIDLSNGNSASLFTYGGNVVLKLNKRINFIGTYLPTIYRFDFSDNFSSGATNYQFGSGTVNIIPKWFKSKMNVNIQYNGYLIEQETRKRSIQQIVLKDDFRCSQSVQCGISYNKIFEKEYLENKLVSRWWCNVSGNYNFKSKVTTNASIKFSPGMKQMKDLGYGCAVNVFCLERLTISGELQKYITDEYFGYENNRNSYYSASISATVTL